jgi:GDPmannose 4,6-dehydratase
MLLADYYRRVHGMFVACGILFNHESPLRAPQFVTQRVVRGLVAIQRGQAGILEIGNLDARVDWGYAPDYTRAMQAILALDTPDDYVVATGETHSVRDLVEIASGMLGLDWRACVNQSASLLQRQSRALCGDATRLRRATGWVPSVDFRTLVEHLVTAALASPETG